MRLDSNICTGCYEKHLRKDCKNGKISWPQYVRKFAHEYPELPSEFFGDSFERWVKPKSNVAKSLCITDSNPNPSREPKMKDFNIPESQAEWEIMISKFKDCGIDQMKAAEMIRERKAEFDKAVIEWNNV